MKNLSAPTLSAMRWKLFWLGIFKIPLLYFVRPKLISIDSNQVFVTINLSRRTKNHLNSMYFGALAVGADVAAGIHAFYFADKHNKKISFSFKSMKVEFIQRAETNITFFCGQGELIQKAFLESCNEKQRKNQLIEVSAFDLNNELVAQFSMELSIKVL
jgi:acyl-coenzyme A thioesterase PaaI-like protein